ncbi:conjugal transfer protein TraX [Ruminococcaceae bacterium OttesenSCG-928-L11]|nr:conjugal transfer protein TraX [Ruminococcaceae bacterium OttesenSCG-928-L11]
MNLKKLQILDGFTLKMIMAVLMLMDHLYFFLPGWPFWFHQVSRVVAPMFAFFVAEGMVYTSNRAAYIGRMALFGGVMLAADVVLFMIFGAYPPNTILISLAITAALIACIDKLREDATTRRPLYLLAVVGLVLLSLFFEGMFICQLTGLVCYYLRSRKGLMCIVYVAVSMAFLAMQGMAASVQALMIFAVIPFLLYNGKRGLNNRFAKYFFYVFYPVHIWILFVVEQLFFV